MPIEAVCFGELLIDFVAMERGVSVGQASGFIKQPGGAPANVAVGLSKMDVNTAFISQLGDDWFGKYLVDVVRAEGVDVSAVRFTDKANTALAFVAVDGDGERSFVFYRKPSADMLMMPDDLDEDMLRECKLFHYGSITLIDDPVRETTLKAIEIARDSGAIISYDPNLRPPLWPSMDAAREGILLGLEHANVVKMSEEELAFVSGTDDLDEGVKKIWRDATQMIVVTLGSKGCVATVSDYQWIVPGFAVSVEDTIGAGDGFVAGLLSGILLLGKGFHTVNLEPILRRANAVGALATTKQGGIPALPTLAEIQRFMKDH